MAKATWTGYVRERAFPHAGVEEIDVAASSEGEARGKVHEALRREYGEGWTIVRLVERGGTYFIP